MDNLAHTLAGAALGQAGLKRRTGLGMATLMIAANIPDIDGVTMLMGRSLALRRGWTHGPIALLLLPVALALCMVAFDRWQTRRGTRPGDRLPVRAGWLLALGYIGIASHVLMDLLNTYGVRCLMPFSDRWFYGDILFIVDVWLWTVLALGIGLSRRRERRGQRSAARPAVIALLLTTLYVGAMDGIGRAAETFTADYLVTHGLPRPQRVLASPVPVDPFRRQILFETDEQYGFGDFRWGLAGSRLTLDPDLIPTSLNDPMVLRAAKQNRDAADFLYWSRFPFATLYRHPHGTEVIIGDARYNRRPEDGRFVVRTVIPQPGTKYK